MKTVITMEERIWRNVLAPVHGALSPAAAKALAKLDYPDEDKQRMRELASKARQGVLTPAEQEEVDAYGKVGSLLSILKSKARQALRKVFDARHR
jgi:hypothetical protein